MASRPRFGRYQILDSLTVGGMAEILLAREEQAHGLERLVVIKRLLPHLADKPDLQRMFLQEARIIAGLSHPNVVRIHELGEASGSSFIAMEYVPGSDLKTLWKAAARASEQIPLEVAVGIVQQACKGAHAAHELADPTGNSYGLVHRDISPPNLMVDDDGHIKLLDFGIAKATHHQDSTRTGILKGKVAYMSPEQVAGEKIDRRSDVFALGIILWEMVTGHRLFARNSEIGSLKAINSGEVPSVADYRKGVPDDLIQVIHWALAQDPADRLQSAAELDKALGHVVDRHGWSARPEVIGRFVKRLLGPRHAARREELQTLMEPTLAGAKDPRETPSSPSQSKGSSLSWLAAVASAVLGLLTVGAFVGIAFAVWYLGQGPPPGPTGEPLVIAQPPTIEAERLHTDLAPLREYLEARLERPVVFEIGESYDATAQRLVRGEVPFATLTPYLYVRTHAAHPEVRALAIKRVEGSISSDSVVLVHEDAGIRSAEDMRGRTICYSDTSSTTGYLLPRQWLRQQGLDPDADLVPHISGNHGSVLRDLNERTCDIGGTFSNNLISAPSRRGINVARLRTLAIAGRSPHDAVCAGPATDPELAALVRDLLLKFVPAEVNPDAALEEITSFAPVDEDAYADLAAAAAVESALPEP